MRNLSPVFFWNNAYGLHVDWTDLYVTGNANGTLYKVDLGTFTVTSTVATSGTPYFITWDGTDLYIANQTPNEVQRVNIGSFTSTWSAWVWSAPRGIFL